MKSLLPNFLCLRVRGGGDSSPSIGVLSLVVFAEVFDCELQVNQGKTCLKIVSCYLVSKNQALDVSACFHEKQTAVNSLIM